MTKKYRPSLPGNDLKQSQLNILLVIKSMSTRIALDKIITKLCFLHVVESYDDRQLLIFLFSLLEIDTLRDVTLSELQNKFNKSILLMISIEHQQQLFI